MREALTFDDVLIIPQYSEVESRHDPDTTAKLLQLDTPVISANMDTVTGVDMAEAMDLAGGLGVLHRFLPREEMLEQVKFLSVLNRHVAVSLGIGDPHKVKNWAGQLIGEGANILVIDVAHGYQKRVLDCLEEIANLTDDLNNVTVVAGNVATHTATKRLWNAGADAVKVGIGPGAACTTRTTTGIGIPQFTAIYDCSHNNGILTQYTKRPFIIADGGIKNTGDFCKAIAAGADAVMMGSIFAGCDEAPNPGVYRGMASSQARESFGIAAGNGYNEHIAEGVAGAVDSAGPVAGIVSQYKKALQSSMSYVGARTIDEYHSNVEFVKVTSSSIIESGSRI